jgi:hypothetical protein
MLMAKMGRVSPAELVYDYYRNCQEHEYSGRQLLSKATKTDNYKKLESIISETSLALKAAHRDIETFYERKLGFDNNNQSDSYYERTKIQDKATTNYYEALDLARGKWERLAKEEAASWFDKKITHGKSVNEINEKIDECLEKTAKATKLFEQTVCKYQLKHIKDYKLKEYKKDIDKLSPEGLQKAYADSCARQATFEKIIKNHIHSAKGTKKGCTRTTHAKFEIDLENTKQDLVLERIAKRTPEKSTATIASNSLTKTTPTPAPSTKTTLSPLSESAKSYAKQTSISQESVIHLGNETIESLAAVAKEVETHSDLAALKNDLNNANINGMEMLVTGQGDLGAQDNISSRPTLADARIAVTKGVESALETQAKNVESTLNAGKDIAKDAINAYLKFGKTTNDTLFYVFDFLNNPKQEGSKLAENIANGAHIFASQFDGNYTRLNGLLSHESEATQTFFHGQVDFYQGAYGKVLSPKTIETIVGAQFYASKIPSHMWERFLENKTTFIVEEGLNCFAAGRIGALVTEVANTTKLGTMVAGQVLKEVLPKVGGEIIKATGSLGEAAITVVQDAKVVLEELAQGVQGAERVALAGIEETIPAAAEKGLANSMLREGGEVSSSTSVRDILKVNNMKEFFTDHSFGRFIKDSLEKTKKLYDGQALYKVTQNINGDLKKGYYVYLDGLHKDHLEVFTNRGGFHKVLNLDGTTNFSKTEAAFNSGRSISNLL